MNYNLISAYQPSGDKPEAIKQLVAGLNRGDKAQTLRGVTGSGKTFILIHRIKYLIKTLRISPNHILVITFTRKAAEEMRTRFMALDIPGKESVNFGTFHSVYYQFIRLFNKGPVPHIMSIGEKNVILNRIINSAPKVFDPNVYLSDFESLLSAISLYNSNGYSNNISYP